MKLVLGMEREGDLRVSTSCRLPFHSRSRVILSSTLREFSREPGGLGGRTGIQTQSPTLTGTHLLGRDGWLGGMGAKA